MAVAIYGKFRYNYGMTRIILLNGLILTVVAFALTWMEYKFWMRDFGWEVYGLVIAVLFALLGVWIERQRHRSHSETPAGRNEKAIRALGLTTREIEVLECLRLGESNKEIARSLGISPNTVKTHLKSLYNKIGANNRTQAVTQATELSIYMPT